MYELVIIGGGPAGVAAGVYAARKQLKTALIAAEFGGQSIVSPDIQNWIGTPSISGEALKDSLVTHLKEYEGEYLTIVEDTVTDLKKKDECYMVTTKGGVVLETQTVLIASGAHRRKLAVPGAAEYDQKGLTYCASCDGPLFSGLDVAVVGGGNAGFETAAQLLAYVKSVTLLDTSERFKAEAITVEKVLAHENMTAYSQAETLEILGEKMVSGLRYRDNKTGDEHTLDVKGVFVEIGMVPNTEFAKGVVDLNNYGKVVTDPRTMQTSASGVWAAGDCTDELYHQNNIAAGDAVKAVEDIYVALRTR